MKPQENTDDTIKSDGSKYICLECKNENTYSDEKTEGDVLECEFCGIEYECLGKNEEGNCKLRIIEEEK